MLVETTDLVFERDLPQLDRGAEALPPKSEHAPIYGFREPRLPERAKFYEIFREELPFSGEGKDFSHTEEELRQHLDTVRIKLEELAHNQNRGIGDLLLAICSNIVCEMQSCSESPVAGSKERKARYLGSFCSRLLSMLESVIRDDTSFCQLGQQSQLRVYREVGGFRKFYFVHCELNAPDLDMRMYIVQLNDAYYYNPAQPSRYVPDFTYILIVPCQSPSVNIDTLLLRAVLFLSSNPSKKYVIEEMQQADQAKGRSVSDHNIITTEEQMEPYRLLPQAAVFPPRLDQPDQNEYPCQFSIPLGDRLLLAGTPESLLDGLELEPTPHLVGEQATTVAFGREVPQKIREIIISEVKKILDTLARQHFSVLGSGGNEYSSWLHIVALAGQERFKSLLGRSPWPSAWYYYLPDQVARPVSEARDRNYYVLGDAHSLKDASLNFPFALVPGYEDNYLLDSFNLVALDWFRHEVTVVVILRIIAHLHKGFDLDSFSRFALYVGSYFFCQADYRERIRRYFADKQGRFNISPTNLYKELPDPLDFDAPGFQMYEKLAGAMPERLFYQNPNWLTLFAFVQWLRDDIGISAVEYVQRLAEFVTYRTDDPAEPGWFAQFLLTIVRDRLGLDDRDLSLSHKSELFERFRNWIFGCDVEEELFLAGLHKRPAFSG